MPKYSVTEKSFDKIIKERGKEYYDSDMVGELYNISSNIYSKINGYLTIIGPKCIYCSCPYNDYCKHMYALLLKIKNENIPPDLMDNIKKMKKNELINLLEKIIDKSVYKSLIIPKILSNPDNNIFSESDNSDSEYY